MAINPLPAACQPDLAEFPIARVPYGVAKQQHKGSLRKAIDGCLPTRRIPESFLEQKIDGSP